MFNEYLWNDGDENALGIEVGTEASQFENNGPFFFVGIFCIKHRHEVMIPEIWWVSVGLHMVFICVASFSVHIPGIPPDPESWHRIRPPMEVDAQFGILKPLGCFVMLIERLPSATYADSWSVEIASDVLSPEHAPQIMEITINNKMKNRFEIP